MKPGDVREMGVNWGAGGELRGKRGVRGSVHEMLPVCHIQGEKEPFPCFIIVMPDICLMTARYEFYWVKNKITVSMYTRIRFLLTGHIMLTQLPE